jgi:hypothetical protein
MKVLIRNEPPPEEKPLWEGMKLKCSHCKSVVQLEVRDMPQPVGDMTAHERTFEVHCCVCARPITLSATSQLHRRNGDEPAHWKYTIIIPDKHKPDALPTLSKADPGLHTAEEPHPPAQT